MLYYADKQREVNVAAARRSIVSSLHDCEARLKSQDEFSARRVHPDLVANSIAFGEIHQAVADWIYPDVDGASRETDLLSSASVALGTTIHRSYRLLRSQRAPTGESEPGQLRYRDESSVDLLDSLRGAAEAVSRISVPGLPERLTVKIPEGYAFYSLYPEMYFASVERMVRELNPARIFFAIGIRSIGTSLAGMVAGALQEGGLDARMETVRPRGHPFDRYLPLDPSLSIRIASAPSSTIFVVVDEGPGLTCSSFLSVSTALESLGISPERIVMLSAWRGVPSIYAAEAARSRWYSQRVYFTDTSVAFDEWKALLPFVEAEVASEGARPERRHQGGRWLVEDLSYGRWRERCYDSSEDWPAIHRPAERTKLLLTRTGQASDHDGVRPSRRPDHLLTGQPFLAKFVGLGEYGRAKLDRAKVLADNGFTPPVTGLAYGFLLQRFVGGRPLSTGDLSDDLVRRIAEYYAFLASHFALPARPRFDQLAEMILFNSAKALDVDASSLVEYWRNWIPAIDSQPLALVDGRPFPHEWLEVGSGEGGRHFLKTDSADHFLDHTLVGEQSILWDLAGACEEWNMDPGQVAILLDAWELETGDTSARVLLGFYRAAYLSFRTAELHYAIHSTDEDEVRQALIQLQLAANQRLRSLVGSVPVS